MKITMKTNAATPKGSAYNVGKTYDVDEATGREFVRAGFAVEVAEPVKEKAEKPAAPVKAEKKASEEKADKPASVKV